MGSTLNAYDFALRFFEQPRPTNLVCNPKFMNSQIPSPLLFRFKSVYFTVLGMGGGVGEGAYGRCGLFLIYPHLESPFGILA